MSLLNRLKAAIGLTNSRDHEDPVAVTVEHQPEADETATASQAGTQPSQEAQSLDETTEVPEPTEESQQAESIEETADPSDLTDESEQTESLDETAEASELADESEAESLDETIEAAEPTEETEPEAEESVSTEDTSASVTEISGIGPAYGERLAQAGIQSVADLARADVSNVAADTELSETRVRSWISDAQERVDAE